MLQIDAFVFRTGLDLKMGVTGAWLAAVWSRSKRVPPLKRVLKKLEGADAPPKSKDEIRTDVDQLANEMAPDIPIIGE